MSAALSLIVHRGKSQTGRQGECSFKSHFPQRKDTQGDKVSAALSLVVHRGKSQRGRQGECSFKSHCAQRKATCRETG